jgi:plastocyanin
MHLVFAARPAWLEFRNPRAFMTPIARRRTLLATLVLSAPLAASVAASGCAPSPASAVPAAPSASAAASAKPPSGPRIVGAVSSQGTGWKGGGVVYLEDAPKQPGVATTATIDVHNKEFSPLISVITTGGTVTFGNKDNLTHHVFSPDVPNWDTGYLKKDESTAGRRFDTPGAISLLCNIHPEMIGFLVVIPSTYFGKVDPDGKYLVANVPPGTYKATLWAPRTKPVTQSVTVAATGAVTANFEVGAASTTK